MEDRLDRQLVCRRLRKQGLKKAGGRLPSKDRVDDHGIVGKAGDHLTVVMLLDGSEIALDRGLYRHAPPAGFAACTNWHLKISALFEGGHDFSALTWRHCKGPLTCVEWQRDPTCRPSELPKLSRGQAGLGLFFHGDRNGAVRGQAHLLSFDVRDQAQVDIMMMALVASHPAIGFDELDLAVLDPIHRSDVNAVGADDFHMLFDPAIAHVISLAVVVNFPPATRFHCMRAIGRPSRR